MMNYVQVERAQRYLTNIEKYITNIFKINTKENYTEAAINELRTHVIEIFLGMVFSHYGSSNDEIDFVKKFAKKYTDKNVVGIQDMVTIRKRNKDLFKVIPNYLLHISQFDSYNDTSDCKKIIDMIINLCIEFATIDESFDEQESQFITKLRDSLRKGTIDYNKQKIDLKSKLENKLKKQEEKEENKKENKEEDNETIQDIIDKLECLVGLKKAKKEVETLINLARVNELRKTRGMPVITISNHIVFTGNPGTGKTTVARILSRVYGKIGVLSKGHLIEASRDSLVAGYVGQTATKTKQVIDSAKGGVLFIDEAYSLSQGGKNDFGKEAIDTLVKYMEDNRDDLIVIVAGYKDEMKEFIDTNPGLKSRFNKYIQFEDFTANELVKIFDMMIIKNGYKLKKGTKQILKEEFARKQEKNIKTFGNARGVRNYFERVIEVQANRIINIENISDEELKTITEEDIMGILK